MRGLPRRRGSAVVHKTRSHTPRPWHQRATHTTTVDCGPEDTVAHSATVAQEGHPHEEGRVWSGRHGRTRRDRGTRGRGWKVQAQDAPVTAIIDRESYLSTKKHRESEVPARSGLPRRPDVGRLVSLTTDAGGRPLARPRPKRRIGNCALDRTPSSLDVIHRLAERPPGPAQHNAAGRPDWPDLSAALSSGASPPDSPTPLGVSGCTRPAPRRRQTRPSQSSARESGRLTTARSPRPL